jgi:DNA repair protein RadC
MTSAAAISLPPLAEAPRARALTGKPRSRLLRDGPRERVLAEGVEALGDAELLAVLLGTGTTRRPVAVLAAELLERCAGLEGLLRRGPSAIAEQPGVGLAKALRIGAALELGRRAVQREARLVGPLCDSRAVVEYLRPRIGPLDHEELWLLALDGRNYLRSARRIGMGGLHTCTVHARDVLRLALLEAASTFVLVHNHPSGDPTPSPGDASMTRRIAQLGELVGVPLVDHVIVARGGGHSSMLDIGVLTPVPVVE